MDAGTHTVEFEFVFEPFEKGEKISAAGSILVILILLGSLGYALYNSYFRKPEEQV